MIGPLTVQQRALVAHDRPVDGEEIDCDLPMVLAKYRREAGSYLVTLVDESEAAWEAFCGYTLASRKPINRGGAS